MRTSLLATTVAITAALLATALTACGSGSLGGSTHGQLRIVAAEGFWGSIATQLAGSGATVTSIVADPGQDPHDYEPKPSDARVLATARLAIVNGVGYDAWSSKLLDANPVNGRVVLNVGGLLGLKQGANPHRWYDPANVEAVAHAIVAGLKRIDPQHTAYFDDRLRAFETRGLARYHALVAQIKARYGGVRVGASESIFALQAPALGLDLVTPPSFMDAISEGSEVSAHDTATAERQLATREISVWVYNAQNATPNVQRLNALARAHGIPIVTVTETMTPAGASFQQWQGAQLTRLERALQEATGR